MKILLLCFVLLSFEVFAKVRELAPIQTPKVINLDGENYGITVKTRERKQLKEKDKNAVDELLKRIPNFKKVTTEKHDWNKTLAEINEGIDEIKKLISKTKNAEELKKYDAILTELTFYRGVVHLHLKHYGLSMLDMRYVVKKDKSYFEKKPVVYSKQELNLDEVMTAVWKFLHKIDTYYCNLGFNHDSCNKAIDYCYSQLWTATCRDIQYTNQPYNDDNFIDIETVLDNNHFNQPCQKFCLFIDKDIPLTRPANGAGGLDDDGCAIYQTNKATQYLQQLTKYKTIGGTGKKSVEDYFCRGFTNVMLIGEGTTVANAVYIENAKADIKSAITINSGLSGEQQVKELDDKFVTEIFNKYNQIVTKDMTGEQLALINSAASQENLQALKAQMDDNTALINASITLNDGIITPVTNTDSLKIDNMPDVAELNNIGYGQNALQNVTNITNITSSPALLEAEKTQALLNGTRMNQITAQQAEANLQQMLEMIQILQATGDF